MFTPEELKNILALINIAPIKGNEATIVALLQQKISILLTPPAKTPKELETETTTPTTGTEGIETNEPTGTE